MATSVTSAYQRRFGGYGLAPLRSRAIAPSQRAHNVVAKASSMPVKDRVIAAVPYLVPMCDGLKYGKFLMMQYPVFAVLLQPITPFARLYFSNPILPLVIFFGIYLGIVNNQSLDRSVRFNALQAILLDIILILPSILESTLRPSLSGGPFLQLYITCYNTIFLFVLAAVIYGMGSCIAGQVPRIPLVASAADGQVR